MQFGGPVFSDSHKQDRDLELDFGMDIEADACAAPMPSDCTNGYESDDETDVTRIKKNLREVYVDRLDGMKPDVEEDSKTSQSVQTGNLSNHPRAVNISHYEIQM